MPALDLCFGPLKAFPIETKGAEKYQVLYVEVLENKSLLGIQEIIGDHYDGVKWRYRPEQTGIIPYNPHIAVAFVKEGVAEKCLREDARIINDKNIHVSEVVFRKFRDTSFIPVTVNTCIKKDIQKQ